MSAWHGLREERELGERLARQVAQLFPPIQTGRVATMDGRWAISAYHPARRGYSARQSHSG
ncbi:hypothetical protein D3C78_1809590 [compost metagenome]